MDLDGRSVVNSSLIALGQVIYMAENGQENCATLQSEGPIKVSNNVTDLSSFQNDSKFLEEHEIKVKVHLQETNCGREHKFICQRAIPHTGKKNAMPTDWRYYLPMVPKVTVSQCSKDSIDVGTK